MPTEFEKLTVTNEKKASGGVEGTQGGEEEEKKRQKRGGKGVIRANKKKEDDGKEKKITVSRAPRGKKKSVTVVIGLHTFGELNYILMLIGINCLINTFLGVDLKAAAKFFGTKFACGSSVTGEDEIVIQGDVKDDLFDVIPEKWPEIDEDAIDDIGDQKR